MTLRALPLLALVLIVACGDETTGQDAAQTPPDAGRPDMGGGGNPDAAPDGGVTNPDAEPDAGEEDSGMVEALPEVIAFSAAGHDRLLGATYDRNGNLYAVGYVADSTISPDFNMLLTKRLANGEVDRNFGTDGVVRMNLAVGGNAEQARGIVVQSTGKIVISSVVEAAGAPDRRDRDIALARFDVDGSLDMDFGTNGIEIVSISTGTVSGNNFVADNTWGLSVYPNDDLLIAGAGRATGRLDLDFALVRLSPDGELDNEFGTNGIFMLDDPTAGASPRTATILADGSVIGAGYVSVAGVVSPVLYKVDEDGDPDMGFGVNGVYTEIVLAQVTEAYGAALQGTSFVTAGYGRDAESESLDWVSLRIDEDGERDMTYGTNGVVRIDVGGFNDNARAVLVLPDNRIVMVGGGRMTMENNDAMIAILTADGQPDTNFSANGYKLWDLGGASDFFWGVALSPDNTKLALVGTKQVANNSGLNDDSAIFFLPVP